MRKILAAAALILLACAAQAEAQSTVTFNCPYAVPLNRTAPVQPSIGPSYQWGIGYDGQCPSWQARATNRVIGQPIIQLFCTCATDQHLSAGMNLFMPDSPFTQPPFNDPAFTGCTASGQSFTCTRP